MNAQQKADAEIDDANPMGLMGFEFVEFASPEPGVIEQSQSFRVRAPGSAKCVSVLKITPARPRAPVA